MGDARDWIETRKDLQITEIFQNKGKIHTLKRGEQWFVVMKEKPSKMMRKYLSKQGIPFKGEWLRLCKGRTLRSGHTTLSGTVLRVVRALEDDWVNLTGAHRYKSNCSIFSCFFKKKQTK